ncbi:MAG TPA: Maf family protein [Bacteroidota bacterium]|nr:Maf family protein [Bacteroidota bacterium]
MSKRIILASGSPRRRHLLRQIGFSFTVDESDVPEDTDGHGSPSEIVLDLSRRKAAQVASRHPDAYIIGADTIVVLDGAVLGKPSDAGDAGRMLRLLSGRTHEVYTGFCVIEKPGERSVSDYEVTKVTFRRLSEEEIDSYVRSGSPMDKAGAYGIQDDYGAIFVEKIEGCFYNVVGFPLTRFYLRFSELAKN